MLTIRVVSFLLPAAKPLHHHGKECLRLKVDVVAADGEFNHPPGYIKSAIATYSCVRLF